MKKIVIVEDSRLARNELRELLASIHDVEIVGEAKNGEEALKIIQGKRPDAIFLDINLPDMSGFDILEKLNEIPQIIFTTAYDEFAIKSFEYNTLDYLLKPIKKERLINAVDKIAVQKTQRSSDKLKMSSQVFLKDGQKCWIVKLEEIQLFESVGNYVEVFFREFSPLLYKSLNKIEQNLNEEYFFRVNRQQIINLNYITRTEIIFKGKLRLIMQNGKEIDVSERQSVYLKKMLSLG